MLKIEDQYKAWRWVYYIFLISWCIGAALSMYRIKAGMLTNYLADFSFPAWFYIFIRGLHTRTQQPIPLQLFGTWFGKTPQRAFASIFLVGCCAELYSFYTPGSGFGVFDVLDIAAYFIPMFYCYLVDIWQIYFPKKVNSDEKSR